MFVHFAIFGLGISIARNIMRRKKDKKITDDFEYVVEKLEQSLLCFGSKGIRTLDIFQKACKTLQVCPFTYNLDGTNNTSILARKPCSCKGTGFFASTAPRFPRLTKEFTPSPNRYNTQSSKKVIQDKFAFGSGTNRTSLILNSNAGVGAYDVSAKKCRRIRFQNNFGQPKMMPTVELICVPKPIDKCDRCVKVIEGDYWHRNYTNYLCQICMADEKHVHELYTEQQLKQFTKIRNCSFMHRHEGTTAAVRLLTDRQVRKKYCIENYLKLFMKMGN